MNRAYLRPPLPLFQVAALLTLPLTGWLCGSLCVGHLGPLQRMYWPDYVQTTLPNLDSLPSILPAKAVAPKREYQVLVCGPGNLPLTLRSFPATRTEDVHLAAVPMPKSEYHPWLKTNVYGGKVALAFLLPGVFGSLVLTAVLGGLGWRFDQERHLRFRSVGRHLEGPQKVSAREFNRRVRGKGIGIRQDRTGLLGWLTPELVRIHREVEAQHQLFQGETGSGKTQALMGLVDQFEAAGNVCVIYDPHREFIRRYYRAERGDVILGPDERCAYWNPSGEVDYSTKENAEASALSLAASLYPGKPTDRDFFFVNSARSIFQHVLTNYGPDAGELADLMTHADPLIDAIAKGTELEEMLKKNTNGLRASIVSTLTQCLFALRQVPQSSEGRPVWSATEWAKERKGWIFLTSTQETREATSHLQRLWIDSVIRHVLSLGAAPGKPMVRVVLDELPTLGRLSNMVSALSEGRKSRLDMVMGYQSSSAIKAIYGDDAAAVMSAPYTVVILRTGEPESAEWASKRLGDEEVERVREHRAPGGERSYTTEQRVERITPQSELAGLKNRHGYLRFGEYVVPMHIAIAPARPDRTMGFVPRTGEPPVTLPMPNLGAIRAAEQAEKEREAAKRAASIYTPPPPPPGKGRRPKTDGNAPLFGTEGDSV